MRETRNAQATLFDHYAKHEFGRQLEKLSELLDGYPQILDLVAGDFDKANVASTGACGLSIESIPACGRQAPLSGAQTNHAVELPQTGVLLVRFLHLPDLCSIKGRPVAQQVGTASHRATNPAGHAVANPQAVDVGLAGSR